MLIIPKSPQREEQVAVAGDEASHADKQSISRITMVTICMLNLNEVNSILDADYNFYARRVSNLRAGQ